MMNNREMKKMCYIEALEDATTNLDIILNHLLHIEEKEGIFKQNILDKDRAKTLLDIELSLSTVCIILRKMSENRFIELDDELRRDINSVIHSNRFEYDQEVIVYSQRGKEEVNLKNIRAFCDEIITFDKEKNS